MPNTVNSYLETDLGNVSPNPRGEYNATYDYEYLDLIYYKGGSYLCLAPLGETIKNVPPIIGQTTTNWQCVAIPGDLTPEYISMYNEVVKDYNETNANTADVAQMKASTYASMTAAQESESKASTSETNARNSEVNAKQSMDKAKEYSDEAIRANNDTQSLVTGFDEHVATAISNAEASISESTDNAKGEIVAQKSSSLNEFRTDAETVMTNEKNMAITEIHQMVDNFSADADSKKQEVIQVADEKINDMTALKNDAVNAKNAAETAATTAVEKASETATYAGEAKSSSDEAKANADLVAADKAIVAADKTEIGGMKSAVESSVAKFESDLETYNLPTMNNDINELKSDLTNVKNATVTEKYSTNLYNEANAEVGYRCVGGGGTTTAENSVLSEYIAIPDGMTYAVPSAYYNNRYRIFSYTHGFYDSDKKAISGSGGPVTSGIPIPSSAKYFRASWLKDTTSQRFINFNTDGSLFPYEEYYEPILEVKTSKEVVEKLDNYESRISALENSNEIPVDRVICWGDSLTDGSGASGTAHQYPFVLKSLINDNNNGIVTDSAGQGGEGTYSIATRQGGVVVNVKPCTIPSSGSVNIKIDKWNGLIISLCRRGGKNVTADNTKMKINPCYIAGVKGTLLRDNDGKYVFTRAEVGEEVTFTRPVPLLTYAHENYNGENEVAIIWSGTNDIAENGGTIEKTIQGINMMIARLKSNKYIVVGLTSKAYHPDIDDKNFRMATEYKDHFVNVRDYILAYGLEDSGITATEQDLTDIENGEIPTSLRVDGVHGNDYFYDIVAKLVYKKGKELGYWN